MTYRKLRLFSITLPLLIRVSRVRAPGGALRSPRIRILAGCGAFFCVKKPGVLKKSVFYGLFISPIF